MHPFSQYIKDVNRRSFLKQSLSSLGVFALGDLIASDNANSSANFEGLHYPAKVKRVIHLCMAGGPSHLETFDYKPALEENDGKAMPESFTKGEQIAQLQGAELKVKGLRSLTERKSQVELEETPFVTMAKTTDLGRFFRYWNKAKKSALRPQGI